MRGIKKNLSIKEKMAKQDPRLFGGAKRRIAPTPVLQPTAVSNPSFLSGLSGNTTRDLMENLYAKVIEENPSLSDDFEKMNMDPKLAAKLAANAKISKAAEDKVERALERAQERTDELEEQRKLKRKKKSKLPEKNCSPNNQKKVRVRTHSRCVTKKSKK